MIAVDTNILAYMFIPGERTEAVRSVFRKDPHWIAPLLWRSEFRNVLAMYIRHGHLSPGQAQEIIDEAETFMFNNEYQIPSQAIINLVSNSNCSAYDLEFVTLALTQKVFLISSDKKILSDFPHIALSPEKFIDTRR